MARTTLIPVTLIPPYRPYAGVRTTLIPVTSTNEDPLRGLTDQHSAEEREARAKAREAGIRLRCLHSSPEWKAMRERHEADFSALWDEVHGTSPKGA